jgi:hypothetical protein
MSDLSEQFGIQLVGKPIHLIAKGESRCAADKGHVRVRPEIKLASTITMATTSRT